MSQRRAGVVLSLVAAVLYGAIAFVTTPILVRGLGIEAFGTYSMALAILAIFMLFDGGLTDAVLRFAVRERGAGRAALGAFLSRTLPLYGVMIAALVVGGALLLTVATFVDASPRLRALLALAVCGAVATLMANPLKAAMSACEHFVAARTIEMATAVLTAVLGVLAVRMALGPVGVLAAMVVGLWVLFAARLIYVSRVLCVRLRFGRASPKERAEIVRYALPILASLFVEAVYWRIDTLVVGAILGPAAVALYAVALVFQKHLMRLSAAVSRVMVPKTLADVDAGHDGIALATTLASVARVQALLLGIVLIGLAAFGDTFLVLWLGEPFGDAFPLMMVILCAFVADQVGSLRHVVLQARGLYWRKAGQALAIALLNLGLTVLVLPLWGLMGAASATAIGLLAGLVAANRLLARHGGVDVVQFHRLVVRAVGPTLLACALAAMLVDALPLASWWGLVAKGAAYGVACAGLVVAVAMTPAERAGLMRGIGRLCGAAALSEPGRG